MERMRQASLKQNKVFQHNLDKRNYLPEKEKYAQQLEYETDLQAKMAQVESQQLNYGERRVPLGKVINQVEMTNPEARRYLKEMLEFQILEKANSGHEPTRFAHRPSHDLGSFF